MQEITAEHGGVAHAAAPGAGIQAVSGNVAHSAAPADADTTSPGTEAGKKVTSTNQADQKSIGGFFKKVFKGNGILVVISYYSH